MNRFLFLIPLLAVSAGMAYAEPLEDVHTSVMDSDGSVATVQLEWNHDETVMKYEIGCVSCIPNLVEFVTQDNVVLEGVTAFPDTLDSMLYVIAYGSNDEILDAKQILVDIS